MSENIEAMSIAIQLTNGLKKDFVIEVRDFNPEFQILFTQDLIEPLPIPNLNFGEGIRVGNKAGCVMCPRDSELSTKVVVDVLEHLKQTGIVIHSIKSVEPSHDMVDFEKIQNCISEL